MPPFITKSTLDNDTALREYQCCIIMRVEARAALHDTIWTHATFVARAARVMQQSQIQI